MGGYAEWGDSATVNVTKYDHGVQLKNNELNCVRYTHKKNENGFSRIETIITKKVGPLDIDIIQKGELTYVPLRLLFEAFGLMVGWEPESKTVHVEMPKSAVEFPNIDFKDAEVISIQDLSIDSCQTFIFDGETVEFDYISLLRNSDQYRVIIKDNAAYIFSCQYMSDLNYLYGKVKELRNSSSAILLYRPSEAERTFFHEVYSLVPLSTDEIFLSSVGSALRTGADPSLRSWYVSRVHVVEEDLNKIIQEVQSIAEEIRKQTNVPKEQAILATKILHNTITYSGKISGQGAYAALVQKEAVCGGISDALQFVLEELKIPVMEESGSQPGKDGTWLHHGWNRVFVDGAWYLFDATWGVWMQPLDYHKQFIQPDEQIKTEQLMLLTYRFF